MSEDTEIEPTSAAESSEEAAAHLSAKLGFTERTDALEELLEVPSLAFDVLSSSYRRHVIQYLLDTQFPVGLDDLAEFVAARARDTSPAAITAGEKNEVATRLIHVHLPKLQDFELIDWRPERGEILLYSADLPSREQHGRREQLDSRPSLGDTESRGQ